MTKICLLLTLLVCLLPLFSGCRRGFQQGGVSSGTTAAVTDAMTPAEEMRGYWFSPEELLVYYFAEDGDFILYEMSSPTSVRSQSEGRYTLEGDRITLTYGGKSVTGRMTTDGKSALYLTIDGVERTLTPTQRPET